MRKLKLYEEFTVEQDNFQFAYELIFDQSQ